MSAGKGVQLVMKSASASGANEPYAANDVCVCSMLSAAATKSSVPNRAAKKAYALKMSAWCTS